MNYDNYDYDSCVAKGICTIGAKTSSLREVLIMYLKVLAFYTAELKSLGGHNDDTKKVILNTISALMFNMETADEQFKKILLAIKTIIIESQHVYKNICQQRNIEPKTLNTDLKIDNDIELNKIIQQGENEFYKKIENVSTERRNLFEIMAFIIKSLCINIVEIKDYNSKEKCIDEGFNKILELLNLLNFDDSNEKILSCINNSVKCNYEIQKKLNLLKNQRFGEPQEFSVSLSSKPNKAILVAGTNLIQLEYILEYTKEENIDIYTHGEMIVAHSYPKFKKYKHLVGHFGDGMENCLLDFANFPGPIFITKFAVENIEYLYRGLLFTSDSFVPKGAIKIENNDFSEILTAAKKSRGFKKGQIKKAVNVGLSQQDIISKQNFILKNEDKYNKIIIFAPEFCTRKNKNYFSNFIDNLPDNFLIFSFTNIIECENVINLNCFVDFFVIFNLLENIVNKNDISIFISKCDKHTIPNIIMLKLMGVKNIFLSRCTPILLNPALTIALNKIYSIKSTSQPLDDLNFLTKNN